MLPGTEKARDDSSVRATANPTGELTWARVVTYRTGSA